MSVVYVAEAMGLVNRGKSGEYVLLGFFGRTPSKGEGLLEPRDLRWDARVEVVISSYNDRFLLVRVVILQEILRGSR